MLVIGIFGSYQTAQASALAAPAIAEILESILLGFGITIFTADTIKNGTSAAWWDTDGSAALKPYYDDLEQAYEEQRFKVINGGGGNNPEPSPTPAPGTSPIPFPTTVPVPGDIPTFKELVAPALAGTAAFINMTQGAWECMGKAVSSWWDGIIETDKAISNEENPFNYSELVGCITATYVSSGSFYEDKHYYYNYKEKVDHFSVAIKYPISSFCPEDVNNNKVHLGYYRTRLKNNSSFQTYVSQSYSSLSLLLDDNYQPSTVNYTFYVPYVLNGGKV